MEVDGSWRWIGVGGGRFLEVDGCWKWTVAGGGRLFGGGRLLEVDRCWRWTVAGGGRMLEGGGEILEQGDGCRGLWLKGPMSGGRLLEADG